MSDVSTELNTELNNADVIKQVKSWAFDALSRREHSVAELRRKLVGKVQQSPFFSSSFRSSPQFMPNDESNIAEVVDSVLIHCQQLGYICDERFAEMYVRDRQQRGYGPLRIRLDLYHKGIDEELVSAFVDIEGDHWFELAEDLYQRRFVRGYAIDHNENSEYLQADTKKLDQKTRAKRLRFFQTRGFLPKHIYPLLGG
ncbi:regulatory protein RecX [Marinibactrum halimedae]|nr:regulatory protein RecX [Marinibactrum halimedae]MCD9458634.1 recombination regulator RecX [Marinibactrum halimedae]